MQVLIDYVLAIASFIISQDEITGNIRHKQKNFIFLDTVQVWHYT